MVLMRRGTRRIVTLVVALCLTASTLAAQQVPTRLADTTFWRMITEMSEPDGYFRSDNLVGNEGSLQWVIPTLQKELGTGNVYLGVAPDQNFTYMAALKPSITFIVDIRRGAMLQHLLYKALFELSADRADFLANLFSRPRPAGLDATTNVTALVQGFVPVRADSQMYARTFAAIKRHLTVTHGFALSDRDLGGIEYVFNAFFEMGPYLTYNFAQGGRGFGARGMPSFGQLLIETDGDGLNRSYLATEDNYRWIRDFESRNLLVPVIGDFAGPKALRAVGDWVRAHQARISAMYVSNVEQYLFQSPDNWRKYYENVATLPITDNALFIRSLSGGAYYPVRQQSPNSRSVQLLGSVPELLAAMRAGRIETYQDVIGMTKP
jgi:hypothetical protein